MILKKRLYGLNKHLLDFINLFDQDKLPKILMLSGKKGLGKFTLVHHLMSYIFDKKNYNCKDTTINESNKLFGDIRENNNRNIIYYNCVDKNIKIEDIRKLRLELQKSSISNLNRFIVFDDVECLSDNCVNALLKTIEEPSDVNYFILINNKSQNILDTLKSRSIEFLFLLNNKRKLDIIKNLSLDHKIENKINFNYSSLTPGNYLKYNKLILDEKIDMGDALIKNLEKILKLHKINKNTDYINFAIFLINHHYFTISKNKPNLSYYNNNRVNIIKKIHQSNKLNLNHKNLILEIENYI